MVEARTHQLLALDVVGAPQQWAGWGFEIGQADSGLWLGSTWVRLIEGSPEGAHGVVAWSIAGTPGLFGLTGAKGRAPRHAREQRPHSNRVVGIDHLVVSHPDLDRAAADLAHAGIEVRRWRDVPGASMRQGFAWLGDVVLELIGPSEPGANAAHQAPAFFGLALTSDDIDATASAFGAWSSPVRTAVQPGRRIITVDANDGAKRKWLAVMSPHPRGTRSHYNAAK